jgi:hypothetical protein
MDHGGDHGGMEIVLLAFILLVGPLAVFFGKDSRIDEVERRRL